MSKSAAPAAPAAPAADKTPSHVLLLARWNDRPVGTVLALSAELLAQLERDGASYRAASDRERRIAAI